MALTERLQEKSYAINLLSRKLDPPFKRSQAKNIFSPLANTINKKN